MEDQIQDTASQKKNRHGGDNSHRKFLNPFSALKKDQPHHESGDNGAYGCGDAEDLGTGIGNGITLGSAANKKG